jgi:hypothetical protein
VDKRKTSLSDVYWCKNCPPNNLAENLDFSYNDGWTVTGQKAKCPTCKGNVVVPFAYTRGTLAEYAAEPPFDDEIVKKYCVSCDPSIEGKTVYAYTDRGWELIERIFKCEHCQKVIEVDGRCNDCDPSDDQTKYKYDDWSKKWRLEQWKAPCNIHVIQKAKLTKVYYYPDKLPECPICAASNKRLQKRSDSDKKQEEKRKNKDLADQKRERIKQAVNDLKAKQELEMTQLLENAKKTEKSKLRNNLKAKHSEEIKKLKLELKTEVDT